MPQLVKNSNAVRGANLAVHTLIAAKSAARFGVTPADNYGRALHCYGRALRAARQATGASHADPREAVLCSLFFAIFERVNGDQAAVAAHLRSGQRILDALAPVHRRDGSGAQTVKSQLKHAVRFLGLQAPVAYSCLSASVRMASDGLAAAPDVP